MFIKFIRLYIHLVLLTAILFSVINVSKVNAQSADKKTIDYSTIDLAHDSAAVKRQIRLANLSVQEIEKRIRFDDRFVLLILGNAKFPTYGQMAANLVGAYLGRLNIYLLPADGRNATFLKPFYSEPLPPLRVGIYSPIAQILLSQPTVENAIAWVQLVTKMPPGIHFIEEAAPRNEKKLTSIRIPQLLIFYDGLAQANAKKIRDAELAEVIENSSGYVGMVQYVAINVGTSFGKERFEKLAKNARPDLLATGGHLIVQGFLPIADSGQPTSTYWEPIQLGGANVRGQLENYIQKNFGIMPSPAGTIAKTNPVAQANKPASSSQTQAANNSTNSTETQTAAKPVPAAKAARKLFLFKK